MNKNPVFEFLHGKSYTWRGVSGRFAVYIDPYPFAHEALIHEPDPEGRQTKDCKARVRATGSGLVDCTNLIGDYCTAARELGYVFPETENSILVEYGSRAVEGAIRKAQLFLQVQDLHTHPEWPGYVMDAEHGDGLAYWLVFDSGSELRLDFSTYAAIVMEDEAEDEAQYQLRKSLTDLFRTS